MAPKKKDFTLNREFKVIFQPKNPEEFGGRRRFAVGAYSLHKYLGEKNAFTAIEHALKCLDNRYTKKFRTRGRIDFYRI